MAFWILVGVLFTVSAVGSVYFGDERRKNDPNYESWIYGCALLFAAIPLTTDDMFWSILVLPLALGTAAMMVARRQKKK
jgi:choline-glycine betaine transporter